MVAHLNLHFFHILLVGMYYIGTAATENSWVVLKKITQNYCMSRHFTPKVYMVGKWKLVLHKNSYAHNNQKVQTCIYQLMRKQNEINSHNKVLFVHKKEIRLIHATTDESYYAEWKKSFINNHVLHYLIYLEHIQSANKQRQNSGCLGLGWGRMRMGIDS